VLTAPTQMAMQAACLSIALSTLLQMSSCTPAATVSDGSGGTGGAASPQTRSSDSGEADSQEVALQPQEMSWWQIITRSVGSAFLLIFFGIIGWICYSCGSSINVPPRVYGIVAAAVLFFSIHLGIHFGGLLCQLRPEKLESLREGVLMCPMVSIVMLCAMWRGLRRPHGDSSVKVSMGGAAFAWAQQIEPILIFGLALRLTACVAAEVAQGSTTKVATMADATPSAPWAPRCSMAANLVQLMSMLLILICSMGIVGDLGW